MSEIFDRAIKLREILLKSIDLSPSPNDAMYQEERKFFLSNYHDHIPSILKNCRTINDVQTKLREVASGTGSWAARKQYIMYDFNDLLNILEVYIINQETNSYNNKLQVIINDALFNHISKLFEDGHYYNAVEESYKFTRDALRKITGEEQAHKAFSDDGINKIFGRKPNNELEKNFIDGVKFIHMSIQNLRNEKSHSPAKELDRNLAIHYITLSSLAYELISTNKHI